MSSMPKQQNVSITRRWYTNFGGEGPHMKFGRPPLWAAAYNVWFPRIAEKPTKSDPNGRIRELTPPQHEPSFSAYLLGGEFHGRFKRLGERRLLPEEHRWSLRAREIVAVAPEPEVTRPLSERV